MCDSLNTQQTRAIHVPRGILVSTEATILLLQSLSVLSWSGSEREREREREREVTRALTYMPFVSRCFVTESQSNGMSRQEETYCKESVTCWQIHSYP